MIFGKKKASPETEAVLERAAKTALSSVAERTADGEEILGKNGGLSVLDREVVVMCDGHEVFRCKRATCTAAALMSGNGITLKGEDESGKIRLVTLNYAKRS